MILFLVGLGFIGAGAILDLIFRERMARAGHRRALVLGGAFNYAEYHRIRRGHGWSAWPVHLMWLLVTLGIGLLIAGFFLRFGTSAHR